MDDAVEGHVNGQAPMDWPSWQALAEGINQALAEAEDAEDGLAEALGVAADALPLSFEIKYPTEKNQWRARGRVKSGDHMPYECERAGADATCQVQMALLTYAIKYIGDQAEQHAEHASPSDGVASEMRQ